MKASGRGGPADEREQREVVELVSKPELDRAQRQIERLQKENERRKRESERLKQESDRLRQEIERLRKELEAALRASTRQAAPHSRGELKANPKPPGRKAGRAYGRRACRPIPPRLDERIDVALPSRCPRCGGAWSWSAAHRNIRKRSYGARWRAALISRWAAAAGVAAE